MSSRSPTILLRYGAAVVAILIGTLARLTLAPVLGDRVPYATIFLAVVVVAGTAGRGPALLATSLGAAAAIFLLPPGFQSWASGAENPAGLALYAIVGSGIAILGGALRDAQQRASTEADRVAREREQYRITLASIGDAVIVTDAEGQVRSLNPVAEALTGWTSAESEGRPLGEVFRIVTEATRGEVENPALRALEAGTVVGLANHTILIARDGTERPIDDSAAPIREEGGGVVGAVLIFRDITQRKRSEAEVRKAGEQAQTILESISDAFFALDEDWRFSYLNLRAEEVLERRRGDLIGRSIWSEYPGTIGSPFESAYRRAASERVAVSFEEYYPDHDCWYEVRCYPAPAGLSVYFRDVSDRRLAEQRERALAAEAAEANARFRAFFEQGALFGGIMQVDGRLIETNRLTLEGCGYSKEQAIGRPFWEGPWWSPSGDLVRRVREACAIAASGEPFRGEMPYFVADGGERIVEMSLMPIKDDSGRVLFLAPMGTDITDRRRVEDALRESERRFHALADSVPVHVWMSDERGRGVLANSRYLEYTGQTAEDLLSDSWPDIIHPDDKDRVNSEFQRAVEARSPHRSEARLRGIDGLYRWFEVLSRPRFDGDRFAGYVGVSIDITDRKAAEEALARSEARFRQLADAMPQIVWVSRSDRTIEFYNNRWFEYTGLTPEESYHPDGWRAAIHPDDVAPVLEASARSEASGEPFDAEYRLRTREGAFRWHLGRAVAVRDDQGRVVRRFGTTTDIDDRKRIESDARFLAEASATLAAIVDEAETLQKVADLAVSSFADWCSVDLTDEAGRPRRLAVAHVDPAKVELALDLQRRYPPDPSSQQGVIQVIRSGTSLLVPAIDEAMIAAAARDEEHHRILNELGLESYMCVPLRGISGSLGAITFVAAGSGRRYDQDDLRMAQDLASRASIALENARLFREIRDSEARFRQLADAMPQIVWTARPEGRIDYSNGRWYELTGLSEPDGTGAVEGWSAVLHPDDLAAYRDRWAEAVGSGRPFELEYRLRDRRSGGYRWHLGRALPVRDDSGAVLKWFGTSTDIDDRKRAEAEIRAARDDAEQANQAKNQFLAVLSHELRTPLNPILLAATSMLGRPTSPEEIRPTLEMIKQNVSLQARLIDDLLDVMRIVRGKMPLHWSVADSHGLIGHAIEICRSDLQAKELQLSTDLAAEHHHVNADSARLEQVLWNLLRNASKFTPRGGAVVVRTCNRPDPDSGSESLIIEVADAGIGIEPEVLPKVFDPFQQGETTITRKFGGLGLGLAICKGVVDAHGGSISAESAGKGRGTTVRVTLKAVPEQPDAPDRGPSDGPDAASPAIPRRLRVLIVEDEPATLRLMSRLLQNLGHSVLTAGTIASGLEAIESGEFDLIISDIGLPDGTGLDLIRRAVGLKGPIPSIALTGYGMEDDVIRSRQAGFTAHMTKPIDFNRLEAMIRQVLSPGA